MHATIILCKRDIFLHGYRFIVLKNWWTPDTSLYFIWQNETSSECELKKSNKDQEFDDEIASIDSQSSMMDHNCSIDCQMNSKDDDDDDVDVELTDSLANLKDDG